MESYVHKGIFRTKSNIYDGAFFTSVKPYFKNVLNSIELPLGSIFYAPNPFVKKLSTLKTSRETEKKSFFQNSITQWNGVIT